MKLITLLASFFVSALFAQTAPTAEQLAQKLTGMHEAWGVRASSPNMTLAIVEQSHTVTHSAIACERPAFLLAACLLWSHGR